MKKSFLIPPPPFDYESFLNVFDLINEEGDIGFEILNYQKDEKLNIDDLSEMMENHGYGMFVMSCSIKDFVKKMKVEIISEDNNYFMLLKAAPLLGLPGDNFKDELKELKIFFEFIKEKALENPEQRLVLQLHRGFGKCGLDIVVKNKILQEELSKEMNEKINSSSVLSQWLKNQKRGIRNTHKQCSNLWATFDACKLIDEEHRYEYLKKSSENKEKNINNKIKNKF